VPKVIHESDVEENVLSIVDSLGYEIIRGDSEDYLPGGRSALRLEYKDVVLVERLREALKRINPSVTEEAREQSIKQVLRTQSQKLIEDNESFHEMLVDGVDVAFQTAGEERYQKVWLFDFKGPTNNDFLAVNQFTVIENNVERRPDVILFVNGTPPADP
jgi:type I restriction enzyme R subunit